MIKQQFQYSKRCPNYSNNNLIENLFPTNTFKNTIQNNIKKEDIINICIFFTNIKHFIFNKI